MSEMQSDTAAVAMDTQRSDDTAEMAVAEDDSSQVEQMRQTYTSEVPDSGSGMAGEVTTEHTADADADAATASSDETVTQHPPTSASINTDLASATPVDVSSTDQMVMSASNDDDIAAGLPTAASEPSSSSASVSCTARCLR